MANTKIPVELSSTPGIVDNSNATAITIDSSENSTFSGNINLDLATPTVIFKESGAAKFFIGESSAVGGGSGYYDLYAAAGLGQRFFTGAAERMRIDSSGNVGIGVSSFFSPGGSRKLLQISNSTSGAIIAMNNNTDESLNPRIFSDANNLGFATPNTGSGVFQFYTAGSERMRIDSSGQLFLGKSSGVSGAYLQIAGDSSNQSLRMENAYGTGLAQLINNTSGQTFTAILFENSGTSGSISVSTTSTTYNTSSDYRLKDVTGEARGLEVINELNPVAYNWKESGQADEGLIAQEVMDIVPNAVSGSEEKYYQMDYSKLVVHLVKGMKEQQAQIEALQSEINLLKGE